MNKLYLLLAAAALLVVLGTAAFQPSPGYMDAQYYYAGALQLYRGEGFNEWLLWNYLDDPSGLPHPSHGYWMPLVSILAAAGMKIAGSEAFAYSRLLPALFAVVLPPATAALAFRLHRRYDLAALSGLLALFSGFYLPFISLTDSFSTVMLLGLCFLAVLAAAEQKPPPFRLSNISLLLGALCGLMHLARADGFLWLFLALAFFWRQSAGATPGEQRKSFFVVSLYCAAGYLMLMAPWFYRNRQVFDGFFAPGNSRALWLLEYNDLYSYPAVQVTIQRWWASGLGDILAARWQAFTANLSTLLVVQGEIFLLPLAVLGLWRLRRWKFVPAAVSTLGVVFLVMTIVFPFAGARGGYFHSGAAFQPLFWLAAPLGLEVFLDWASAKRGWQPAQARRFFQTGAAALAILLTLGVFVMRISGMDGESPRWGAEEAKFARLEQALRAAGIPEDALIMVNNPPGYFAATNRPAIAIPHEDVQTVLAAARRYQARILLLEIDQIPGAPDLYFSPQSQDGLTFLATVEGNQIYEFSGQ